MSRNARIKIRQCQPRPVRLEYNNERKPRMDNSQFSKVIENATLAIHTNEIQDEASALIATIAEGVDLQTIIKELYEYSQSVSAMTLTKILHTMYTNEEVNEMIETHTDSMADDLVSEIADYLEAN
jgi:glutamyl-tRNA reductase